MHMSWYLLSLTCVCYLSKSNSDSLFSRDVALTYGCAIHLSHFHVTLDLAKIQAEVVTADGHKCAPLPRPT